MQQIESFIEIAKLARKQVYRNLTVFPLLAPDGVEPDYLTLEQALEQNLTPDTQTYLWFYKSLISWGIIDISKVQRMADIFTFRVRISAIVGVKKDPF